jgi:hypothetical protein
MRIIGWINVAFAAALFLLSLAPFTPALAAFAVIIPIAGATARHGIALPSLLAVFLFALAVALSPAALPQLLQWPSVLWLASLSACAMYIVAVLSPRDAARQ